MSGGNNDQGLIIPGENFNFASADPNGLVFRRTPQQVLNIVYGGGAAASFLFFPNRVNGTIQ